MANKRNKAVLGMEAEILCRVQQALEDLIVVSYHAHNGKVFQGVLLDATKRNIPFGICPPGGFNKRLTEDNPRDYALTSSIENQPDPSDSFPTVSRRQTYFQESRVEKPPLIVPPGKGTAKSFMTGQETKRLGVRLRARQVLCSKCSSVCNEKGENVRENAKREREARNYVMAQQTKVNQEDSIGRQPKTPSKAVADCSSTSTAYKTMKSKGPSRVKLVGVNKRKTKVLPQKIKNETRRPRVETFSIDTYESGSNDSENSSSSKDAGGKIKPTRVRHVPEIVDLDIWQYDKTKKLAKKNSLVPKIRRLAASEIGRLSEDQSNSDRESLNSSDTDRCPSSNPVADDNCTEFHNVSSSTEILKYPKPSSSSDMQSSLNSCSDSNMQPLKIRFSNLTKQASKNGTERQYSIVKSQQDSLVFRANFDGKADQPKKIESDSEGDSDRSKRKKSPSSIQDDLDNPHTEEILPLKKVFKRDNGDSKGERDKPAPVLKISFGKESTVLKLPPTSTSACKQYSSFGDEREKEKDPLRTSLLSKTNCAISKAAKKALKRAKKEAQRKAGIGMVSPARSYLGGRSPHNRANFSPGQSPAAHRATLPSPARGYGGLSPGRFPATSPARFNSPGHPQSGSPAYTLLCPGSQKLIIKKVKKKKHKKDKEKDKSEEEPSTSTAKEPDSPKIFNSEPRIMSSERSSVNSSLEDNPNPEGIEQNEEFRPGESSTLKILERPGLSVDSAQLKDGHTMCSGDVVWGKAEGNPWWPGKILNLMMIEECPEKEEGNAHAHISWYTSSTTTTIPCTEVRPFLEFYEAQYNKRKKGNYKEAVKLATEDARQASSIPLSGLSPSPSVSPREIFV